MLIFMVLYICTQVKSALKGVDQLPLTKDCKAVTAVTGKIKKGNTEYTNFCNTIEQHYY